MDEVWLSSHGQKPLRVLGRWVGCLGLALEGVHSIGKRLGLCHGAL